MIRIEAHFNNGEFAAFPHVIEDTIEQNEKRVQFVFGDHKHLGTIIMNNVNFIEISEE